MDGHFRSARGHFRVEDGHCRSARGRFRFVDGHFRSAGPRSGRSCRHRVSADSKSVMARPRSASTDSHFVSAGRSGHGACRQSRSADPRSGNARRHFRDARPHGASRSSRNVTACGGLRPPVGPLLRSFTLLSGGTPRFPRPGTENRRGPRKCPGCLGHCGHPFVLRIVRTVHFTVPFAGRGRDATHLATRTSVPMTRFIPATTPSGKPPTYPNASAVRSPDSVSRAHARAHARARAHAPARSRPPRPSGTTTSCARGSRFSPSR